MKEFSHFDDHGASRMVDVGDKPTTRRAARASCVVRMHPSTLDAILHLQVKKGNVLEVARLAGIMAAKQTPALIPLCHPLPLDSVQIQFAAKSDDSLRIEASVEVEAKTGVEMESMTAVSVAALTVYDMCKSADRQMTIEAVRLEEKTGGSSGRFIRD
jgi:cyclic pyranopterin phosphate synthase